MPIIDTVLPGKDEVVDSLLRETRKLTCLKSRVYILYVPNMSIVQKINHKYLQICFSDVIRDDLNFKELFLKDNSMDPFLLSYTALI